MPDYEFDPDIENLDEVLVWWLEDYEPVIPNPAEETPEDTEIIEWWLKEQKRLK